MKIQVRSIINFLVIVCFVIVFFSSTCLWNETQLESYIVYSLLVIGLTILTYLIHPINPKLIINNRYIIWVVAIYCIFELYGVCFLRAGGFNWDLILVSGIHQICLTIMLMELKDAATVHQVFCRSCVISIVIVCLYMINKSNIDYLSINFGDSYGTNLSGNRNTVATCIGIMLVPVCYLVIIHKKCRRILALVAIVSASCMLLTGSKKSVLIIILIALMAFAMDRRMSKYLLLPIVAGIGIYAIFNVPFLYNVVGYRITDMFAALGIGNEVTAAQSTSIRSSLIHMGLKSMWDYPIFGGGMNYFQYINHTIYYSHNNYIELLNNFGIVGTLLFYVPTFAAVLKIDRSIKCTSNIERRNVLVFLLFYLLTKLVLDLAAVNYTDMCMPYVELIFVFEMLRRGVAEIDQEGIDRASIIGVGRS